MATKDNNISDSGRLMLNGAFAGVNYIQSLANKSDLVLSNLLQSTDGPNEATGLQANTQSLFNKFTIFQYAGLNAGLSYRVEGHFIGMYGSIDQTAISSDAAKAAKQVQQQLLNQYNQSLASGNNIVGMANAMSRKNDLDAAISKSGASTADFAAARNPIISNPNAAKLIEWGANHSNNTPQGFQPYSFTDFIFCKHYGRIPNNRLVTMRRYPQPIGDSLHSGRDRSKPAIPIAQAVTWFGSDTGNTLNSLGVFGWDMPWKTLQIDDYQAIDGNEVTLTSLLDALKKSGAANGSTGAAKNFIESLIASTNNSSDQLAQITKFDEKQLQYAKDLYTKGPYWNRVYGPVNVINATTRRDRGIQTSNWQKSFDVNFHYSFRSFNRMSPKIVALDLISNFMNLTYNDAQFLGQLTRYFQKPGLKADPAVTEALGDFLTNLATSFSGDTQDFSKILGAFANALDKGASSIMHDPINVAKRTVQTMIAARLSDAIPQLISVKSALSDRPIGEWHITVGNPMNPIFVMGDLIVTDTKMKWDEELGPDDFPTGCTFTVTLKQGKPRDKTAIERMLNLGEHKLTAGILRTSSADDTFGTENNKQYNDGAMLVSSEALQKAQDNAFSTGNKKYMSMVNRFRQGYGITQKGSPVQSRNTNGLDDSVLALYYQRNLGHS